MSAKTPLATISQASDWATSYLDKEVSSHNISYLVQYGKIKKYKENGLTLIDLNDLKKYYQSWYGKREISWRKTLGDDLDWTLSFDNLREKETTKHVHRLHPYKGKFIPQLVQYFIDDRTDSLKREVYFKKGDIILDPFAGSGTTLVEASEQGLHAIGVDISHFNCMIGDVKLQQYDFQSLTKDIESVKQVIQSCQDESLLAFEVELAKRIYEFNAQYFPNHNFQYKIRSKQIKENEYALDKEKIFLKTYQQLIEKYNLKLKQDANTGFLDKWYCQSIRREIETAFEAIKAINDTRNKKALALILSRTIRSCRATTHYDLATLKNPQFATYYCWKHKKMCKPLYSLRQWFNRYAQDTLLRLKQYDTLREPCYFANLAADSRTIDIIEGVKRRNKDLADLINQQKVAGIFTSPPYVGQIDYHEQHAYAYDLFGFERRDDLEIGPLYKGQGLEAKESYVKGIARVLTNCKKYLKDNYNIFLVANDKYNLYPKIADQAGMKIVERFKRPVLNRTERDRNPYAEIIFHLKQQ